MTIRESDRRILITYRIDKAKQALEDACFLTLNQKLHLAVNRVYYSAFHIISALALKNGFHTSTHSELIGWFNKNFIKSGSIEKSHGQFLHKAYDKRSKCDYGDFIEFDLDEVNAMLKEAATFLRTVEAAIKKRQRAKS